MTRKTHASTPFYILNLLLVSLGKPIFKLLLITLTGIFSLSSLIKQISKKSRFNQLNRLYLLVVPIILLSLGIAFLYQSTDEFLKDLPDVNTLPRHNNFASTKLYDRDGNLLYKFYDEVNRTPVKISEVPQTLVNATIAKEDRNFYKHHGVSFAAITRALLNYIKGEKLTGASTITQQLVKNVYLNSERTVARKLKEMVLAWQVERIYSKQQILEFYLNRVPYGGTAYGVQEAAQQYFDKNVSEVNLAEAAFLASRPQTPSTVFISGNSTLRKNNILKRMYDMHYISEHEKNTAMNQTLDFKKEKLLATAPHFVMFAGELLGERFDESFLNSGYEARTTISQETQKIAEEEVLKELKNVAKLHVTNAGVLVISVKTGEILAMVGSRDYNDIKNQGNVNTTISLRQPGSSIKLINYAYALSNGYTPASILDDTPAIFKIKGSPPYKPQNYDGQYYGRISLRDAFAQSRNVPAVRVLESYGVSKMIALGKQMGIVSWQDTSRYGLSLTLGGGEVTLLELANAYLTVANYGKRIPLVAFKNIYNVEGKTVKGACINYCESEQVLSPEVSYQIINILSDNNARARSFGTNSALVIKDHPEVAVKTGTSNNLRDNLAIGFNQDYLVAVWVGNNDGSAMSRIASGVTGASPIWNGIMTRLIANARTAEWTVPSQLVRAKVCGKEEWFVKGTEPRDGCYDAQKENIATKKIDLRRLSGTEL